MGKKIKKVLRARKGSLTLFLFHIKKMTEEKLCFNHGNIFATTRTNQLLNPKDRNGYHYCDFMVLRIVNFVSEHIL